MQLGIGKTLFPSWAASLTLVKDHGTSAYQHASDAVRADTAALRLDHAVRAMTSFDHAIDNTRKLPVQWFVKGAPVYYRGYEAAKQAVTLLVASGLIPGAKERVGRQSLLAAKDAFLAGVDVARGDRSRFGRHLSDGWIEATLEDTLMGAMMLKNGDTSRALLAGVSQVRTAIAQKRPVDEALVKTVSDLFDRATSQLALAVARSGGRAATGGDAAAFERSGVLLAETAAAAKALVAAAPDDSVFEQLPAAG